MGTLEKDGLLVKARRSIVIGADACGLELTSALCEHLTSAGYLVSMLSAVAPVSGWDGVGDDTLAIARGVAATVSRDEQARGILVLGGRVNVDIATNQVAGARAVYISDSYSAERATLRDHANVVALCALTTSRDTALRLVDTWLTGIARKGFTRQSLKVQKIDQPDEVYRLLEAVYG